MEDWERGENHAFTELNITQLFWGEAPGLKFVNNCSSNMKLNIS